MKRRRSPDLFERLDALAQSDTRFGAPADDGAPESPGLHSAARFGVREGQTVLDVDVGNRAAPDGTDVPAEDGWIRDSATGALAAGQAKEMPFNPAYLAEERERLQRLHANEDFQFAQLCAGFASRQLLHYFDTESLANRERQETEYKRARDAEVERLRDGSEQMQRDLEQLRVQLLLQQQEQALIESSVLGAIDGLMTGDGLAAWFSLVGPSLGLAERAYLFPAWMAWQYRFLHDEVLNEARDFYTDASTGEEKTVRLDVVQTLYRILALDALYYGRAFAADPNYVNVVELLNTEVEANVTPLTQVAAVFLDYVAWRDLARTEYELRLADGAPLQTSHADRLTAILLDGLRAAFVRLPGYQPALLQKLLRPDDKPNFTMVGANRLADADFVTQVLEHVQIWLPEVGRTEHYSRPYPIAHADGALAGSLRVKQTADAAALQTRFDTGITDDDGLALGVLAETLFFSQELTAARRVFADDYDPPSTKDYERVALVLRAAASPLLYDVLQAIAPDAHAAASNSPELFVLPRNLRADNPATFYATLDPGAVAMPTLALGDAHDCMRVGRRVFARDGSVLEKFWQPADEPAPQYKLLIARQPWTRQYRAVQWADAATELGTFAAISPARSMLNGSGPAEIAPGHVNLRTAAAFIVPLYTGELAAKADAVFRETPVVAPAEARNVVRQLPLRLRPVDPVRMELRDLDRRARTPAGARDATTEGARTLTRVTVADDMLAVERARLALMSRFNAAASGKGAMEYDKAMPGTSHFARSHLMWTRAALRADEMAVPVIVRDLVAVETTTGALAEMMQRELCGLAALPFLLDYVGFVFRDTRDLAAAVQRTQKAMTDVERTIAQFHRQAAEQDRESLRDVAQRLYMPTAAGAHEPLRSGSMFFTPFFQGALAEGLHVVRDILGFPEVTLPQLTARANDRLRTAFARYIAAHEASVNLEHPNQYKKDKEFGSVPARLLDRREELRRALLDFTGGGGRVRSGGGGGSGSATVPVIAFL